MRFKRLLFIPLLFLIATSVFAQDELLRIHINDFSKGQNSFDLPDIIPANAGVSVKNAIINRRGRLGKRRGVSLFAQDLSDTAWTGIGRFTPDATSDFLMTASGGTILRSSTAASWVTVNPTSPMTVGINTEFIQADKLLLALNGTDRPSWYDGVTYTEGEDIDASPPITKYGAWVRNYLFLANGSIEHDWVWFSNNLQPLKFTDGDVFKVNTGDGQEIQYLKPFKSNELIIYKERSVWVLNLTGITPLIDWTLQPILEDIGLIAPRSVATVGNDQWFLSSEPIGVRSLIRTDLDKIKTSLISQPVQDLFDGTGNTSDVINRTKIDEAASVFFDNKFLLAYPGGTSLFNNRVLIFDAIPSAWYLITNWFVEDWQIFDNKLYFIDSSDGRVLRAFDGNNDQASGPVVTIAAASGPTTRGVGLHYESKEYDFESPELFKYQADLEVAAESTGDYTMEVFINLDGGGWRSIGTMSLEGDSTNLPINLPFTFSTEKIARKTFKLQKYGEFKKIQAGFDQDASDENVKVRSYTIFGKKRPFRRSP